MVEQSLNELRARIAEYGDKHPWFWPIVSFVGVVGFGKLMLWIFA